MNDFTKEELQLLWEYGHRLPGELRPTLDKIKSMIGNYCEHEKYLCCPLCGQHHCLLVDLNDNK